MGDFNLKKFKAAKLEPRIEAVPVPDLKDFFADGSAPVWTVRGLTGHELGQVYEDVEKNRNLAAVLDGLISTDMTEKVAALKADLGLDENTPNDVVRRMAMLRIGSVDPEVDRDTAVKLCTHFPIEFMTLTNKITVLTGRGAEVKKKPPISGEEST